MIPPRREFIRITSHGAVAAIVVGAFLLRWFLSWATDPAMRRAVEAMLSNVRLYEDDPRTYLFWLTTSVVLVRLVENALLGILVAAVAKGREIMAVTGLALLGIFLAAQSIGLTIARTGDRGVLRTLPHTILFSIAIIAAGAFVRTRRMRANTLAF